MQARYFGTWWAGTIGLTLLVGIATASAQDPAYGTAASEIAERIAVAFPRVSGRVIGVERDRVLLDLGTKDKVIPGLELQVYREGQEFRHPYTGQVLGKLDRDVGRVRIVEVQPGFSAAEIIQQAEGTMVQQGDQVRVTSARVILALPNVDVSDVAGANTRSVTRDLLNALVKTGRFEVMSDQRIRAALQEEKVPNPEQLADPAALQALWKRLRVSAVLLPKLTLLEKAVQWDVQVVSTVRGDSIILASAEVKGAAPRVASSSGRPGSSGGQEGARISQVLVHSQEVPFKGQAMAVGEFTGDGTMKLALSDGQGVYVYDLRKGGIKEIWSSPGGGGDNVIALDAGDINGNGVAEIFVTKYTSAGGSSHQAFGRLRSFVLEYKSGRFEKIWDDVPLHFRILEGPENTPVLYAQAAGNDRPFDGPVRQYLWQGNRYVPGAPVPLPKQFGTIYGFALADLDGAGAPKILVLDHQDHLRVYDRGGAELYRSSDRFGGSELAVEYDPSRSGERSRSGIEPERLVLQGRFYFRDILGDGKKQVVVPRNTPSTGYIFKTRLYDKGKILGLTWDGLGMQVVWEGREFPGYIADFALADLDGDGSRKLIALVVQTGTLGTARSRSSVYILDLKPSG